MTTQTLAVRGKVSGSGAAAGALQVSARACTLLRFYVTNTSASTIYVQFHDIASTPADATTPAFPSIPIPAGGYYESDTPRTFSTGCYVCGSSTVATKTLIGASSLQITAETA